MRYLLSLIVILIIPAAAVRAQTTDPSPAEKMLNEMLKPAPDSGGNLPTTRADALQVLEPVGYKVGPGGGKLIREGSDIVAQHGRIRKVQDAAYSELVFDQTPDSSLAPMLVLPNLQLMSMENASTATRRNLDFTVSGLVTEYAGKNYILLEAGPDSIGRQMPTQSPAPAAQSTAAQTPAAHGRTSADQMLKAMLTADKPSAPAQSNAGAVQTDLTSGSAAVAPKAPTLTVLPEQTEIFDRVCRLGPCADGLHEQLTFDSDGSSLQDPPLIVLPNLKLADLEKVSGGQHDTRVRVTGMVTEYRGRNYILLQKVVVMADSDRQF